MYTNKKKTNNVSSSWVILASDSNDAAHTKRRWMFQTWLRSLSMCACWKAAVWTEKVFRINVHETGSLFCNERIMKEQVLRKVIFVNFNVNHWPILRVAIIKNRKGITTVSSLNVSCYCQNFCGTSKSARYCGL